MPRERLGEACVKLGLLSEQQVRQVLEAQESGRYRGHFGDIAIELGLLDEESLAKALAHQFRLQLVPSERVERVRIPTEVRALVTAAMAHQFLLVPTFMDADRGVLTLLCADPTNVAALRAAQEAAGAARLRLFVAPRAALRGLVARTWPAAELDRAAVDLSPEGFAPVRSTLVLEPDVVRRNLITRLQDLEADEVRVVSSPEQVDAALESGQYQRLVFRRSVEESIGSSLGRWRRQHPELRVARVRGWSPGALPDVDYGQARDFFLSLVEFALLAGETGRPEARYRVRRTARLARKVADELGLPAAERDAVAVAAMLADLDQLSLAVGLAVDDVERGHARRFDLARAVLRPLDTPFPVDELFDGLDALSEGKRPDPPNVGASVVHMVRQAVQAAAGANPDAAGEGADQEDPQLRNALRRVMAREEVLGALAKGGDTQVLVSPTVIVAERDGVLTTALEARLVEQGFDVVVAPDGEVALARARALGPAAVVANLRLPRRDGFSLLLELRQDPLTQDVPVILISDRRSPLDVSRGLELGADQVLEKPVSVPVLLAHLRRATSRRVGAGRQGLSGALGDITVRDIVRALHEAARTAVVELSRATGHGHVHVVGGRIVRAVADGQEGEAALVALWGWEEGRFQVRPGEGEGEPNVQVETPHLLRLASRARRDSKLADEPLP